MTFLNTLLPRLLGFLGLAGLSPARLILILLSVVSLVAAGFGFIQTKRLESRAQDLATAQATISQLDETLKQIKKRHELALKELAKVDVANNQRRVTSNKILDEINNAPDDGPVHPIIGRTIERLHERSNATRR